jgi:hypothetical protein
LSFSVSFLVGATEKWENREIRKLGRVLQLSLP